VSCRCPAAYGEDCPLAADECAARTASEAPADAPPATPCDCEIYQTCAKCRGTDRDASIATAEPHAPPAQALNEREVHYIRLARVPNLTHRDVVELADSHEALRAEVARLQAPPAHEVDAVGEEYRAILRRERDEARAEVIRLQEELKQAKESGKISGAQQ
jgi:hypothetical protein